MNKENFVSGCGAPHKAAMRQGAEVGKKCDGNVDLSVEICGVRFKNPVIAASGTFGFGREYDNFFDISLLGGVSTKGLTLKEKKGNKEPRIAEGSSVVLNAVGLQNPGVQSFIKNDLNFLKEKDTVIIANIAGNTIEDYIEMARTVEGKTAFAELNISCPNVKEGGIAFGIKPQSVEEVTRAVKNALSKTKLMVKLSPNVESISANAKAAEIGGADCISLINTFTGMAIDIERKKPVLANITGGVSGAGIKNIALRMVYEAAKSVKIPVIGMGGIACWQDAVEFMLAGASAVQVGTANFTDINTMPNIIDGLYKYCVTHNIQKIADIIGTLEV